MGGSTDNARLEDTRLGTILLETGIIAERELEHCLEVQALTGGRWPLGQILVEQGVISEEMLHDLLEVQRALRRGAESVRTVPAMPTPDDAFLETAIALGANDMFLSEGRQAFARVAGDLVPLSEEPLAGPELWQFVRTYMGVDVLERIAEHQSVTMPIAAGLPARGRITAFRQFDGLSIAIRLHQQALRTPEQAGIDQQVVDAVRASRGLVLVAAESGAGLSETFGTLLQVAAADPMRSVHVLDTTFEYPVPTDGAIVTPRQVGVHTRDWETGVRAALRDEPDVLFVGELDAASFDHVVHAAESTSLVVAGVRAPTTVHALARVTTFRPRHDVARVRSAVASALLAALAVRTVPNADRSGLALATEVLALDDTMRDLVRTGSLGRIRSMLRVDGHGHALDSSLLTLVETGVIRFQDAFTFAQDKSHVLHAHRARVGGIA